MAKGKVKGIDDRISAGFVTNSSENVFEVKTHRMQNISLAQEKKYEKFFFSQDDSLHFKSPKNNSKVRVVFNGPSKYYVQSIYDWNWNWVYEKK